MIEYPEIMASSKAPRKPCIAFAKIDGSNIRVKWTKNKGFCLFGTRTQLIDENTPIYGEVVKVFRSEHEDLLSDLVKREFPNEREIIFFGEFYGANSFAGLHDPNDKKEFYLFDILVGHKMPKFVLPQDFVKLADEYCLHIPLVVYRGNLNEQLIRDVRENKYDLNEGVICKGTERSGAFRGNVWMAKIKTQAYFDRLKARWGEEGIKKYGE